MTAFYKTLIIGQNRNEEEEFYHISSRYYI